MAEPHKKSILSCKASADRSGGGCLLCASSLPATLLMPPPRSFVRVAGPGRCGFAAEFDPFDAPLVPS